MRRMITNKQVVDVVNKAIDDGEIQGGGVTPEQKAVLDQMEYHEDEGFFTVQTNDFMIVDNTESEGVLLDASYDGKVTLNSDYAISIEPTLDLTLYTPNDIEIEGEGDVSITGSHVNLIGNVTANSKQVLTAPASAPAAQQLVGINTSGEQNALSIGDGLEINNNMISAPAEIVKLDFNNSDTLDISDELYNKLFGTGAKNVIIYAYNTRFNPADSAFYTHQSDAGKYVQATQNTHPSSNSTVGGIVVSQSQKYQISSFGSSGSHQLKISTATSKYFIEQIKLNRDIEMSFTSNSGTKTGYTNKFFAESLAVANLYYLPDGPNTSRFVPLYILEYVQAQTILAEGRDATNKYVLNWNLSTGDYTITSTTI